MALHDELAQLREAVGSQAFDDPVAFRAAFDDFIPEGSATTGELSLLVGAISTGALERVREQLALGADPELTIAVQGDALARDRGTTESSGARWALSALAHAIGALPAQRVLTRPTPGPDAVDTVGRPPAPLRGPTPTVGAVDAGPTQPASAPTEQPAGRRRTNPLLIAAVVVLAVVAVTAVALLLLRDDDSRDGTAEDGSSGSSADERDSGGSSGEEVLAEVEVTDAAEPVLVRLVHDGSDAALVLLLQRDGAYTEVDREPTSCPYLDSSYAAGISESGDLDLFWGWSNLDQEGFGEYGRVVLEIESLEIFGVEDRYACPTD